MGLNTKMLNPIPSTSGSLVLFALPEDKANENRVNLYVATGGELSSFFSTSMSGGSNPLPKTEDSSSQLQHIINYITSCFTLTKDELATISKIQSRKTIYNWVDGTSKPRTITMERLFDLLVIAKAWKQANLPGDYESLHYPIFQGVSIFDMLKSDSLDKEKILFAGSRIMLTRSNRTPLKDPFA